MRTAAPVELRGVTKSFGATKAVDDVNVEIPAGAFLSFLGPSGCGKTTTLRMIAGLVNPDVGEIWVGGRLLSSPARVVPPEQRGMSMIFQSYALWPHMTVFENVAYGVKLNAALRRQTKDRVAAMLALVRMPDLADRYPGELSGGQQQRVALARALAIEPAVLLMDEPLSNLDTNLRAEMRFEIRRVHDEMGITTVYVTHDLAEALVVSDRIVVMKDGRVEQVGSSEDIYERPNSQFVAGFMGQTTFVPGTRVSTDELRLGDRGPVLRVPKSAPTSLGQKVLVALRPHDVILSQESSLFAPGYNCLRGVVMRQVYVGDFRDYMVRIDGVDIDVWVKSRERYEPGMHVILGIPSGKCRVVPM